MMREIHNDNGDMDKSFAIRQGFAWYVKGEKKLKRRMQVVQANVNDKWRSILVEVSEFQSGAMLEL